MTEKATAPEARRVLLGVSGGIAAYKSAEIVRGLQRAGFDVRPSDGTYFVVADAAPLGVTDAATWCLGLPAAAGVAAVPVSVFCDDPGPTASLVRFAFCKQEPVLEEACRRLVAHTA